MVRGDLPLAGSHVAHDVFVGLGVVVAVLVFAAETRRRGAADDRLWVVVALALAWGALFSRLGTWLQHLDPGSNAGVLEQWLYGNRSIVGGLVGAYLGALLGKRATGYRQRTGDLFAPAVAAGMAVGRIGCLLTEPPGTPTGGMWGIVLSPEQAARLDGVSAGVALHPSFGYEIAFHAVALVLLVRYRDRLARAGDLFICYLAGYAAFRLGVELVRGNEVVWAGLTRVQLFLLPTTPLLVWRAVVAVRRPRTSSATARPELERA